MCEKSSNFAPDLKYGNAGICQMGGKKYNNRDGSRVKNRGRKSSEERGNKNKQI